MLPTYSTRSHSQSSHFTNRITVVEAATFPTYWPVCRQPTAPETTVESATFPTYLCMYVVNLQQQKPPQWKQPLSQRIRLYVVNLQHQKPQWKQQLSPTYLPVWPQSKQPLSHHTQLYVVNLQHYSTRKHLRYRQHDWSTHFSSMHACMLSTYSTRKYPKHSESQSWGIHFPYFPTIFHCALPTYSTKKHLSGNHSILQHPEAALNNVAITVEPPIFPPYTAVCCQPTGPESAWDIVPITVGNKDFPTMFGCLLSTYITRK